MDPEDIVQETYVRVCQVKQPAAITQPRSFLLKIARNLALDYLKRAETRVGVSLDEEAINLMRQQRAFQGASRLIAAVDEMMQSILALV